MIGSNSGQSESCNSFSLLHHPPSKIVDQSTTRKELTKSIKQLIHEIEINDFHLKF